MVVSHFIIVALVIVVTIVVVVALVIVLGRLRIVIIIAVTCCVTVHKHTVIHELQLHPYFLSFHHISIDLPADAQAGLQTLLLCYLHMVKA